MPNTIEHPYQIALRIETYKCASTINDWIKHGWIVYSTIVIGANSNYVLVIMNSEHKIPVYPNGDMKYGCM